MFRMSSLKINLKLLAAEKPVFVESGAASKI